MLMLAIFILLLNYPAVMADTPELKVQTGHTGWVRSVVFSSDGNTLASASDDNTVKIWDLRSGTELRSFSGSGEIFSVAFSPDGTKLAWGSNDGTVQIFDVASGRNIHRLQSLYDGILSVAFSPDGKKIVSGGWKGAKSKSDYLGGTELWDLETGKRVWSLGSYNEVWAVSFSPDGRTVGSAHDSFHNDYNTHEINIWDVATGKLVRALGDAGNVKSLVFSPDGKRLVSAGTSALIRIWDVSSGVPVNSLGDYNEAANAVAFSPAGNTVASGDDKSIKIWSGSTGSLLQTLGGHEFTTRSISFSPDGKTLASGGGDRSIKIWDLSTGSLHRTLSGESYPVNCISRCGTLLLSSVGDKRSKYKAIEVWDISEGKRLYTVSNQTTPIYTLAVNPNGKTFASVGLDDSVIKIWDMVSHKEIRTLLGHRYRVNSLAYSNDGRMLVSGAEDGSVKFWDAVTGNELRTIEVYTSVRSIAISPDDTTLVLGTESYIKVYDLQSGKYLRVLKEDNKWDDVVSTDRNPVWSVAFSADGNTLASCRFDSEAIHLWDVRSGNHIRTLAGHSKGVCAVSFSPTSKTLASGALDQTIKLWDVSSGQVLQTLVGHQKQVSSLVFSPDGKLLFSGSPDSLINLWNTSTGQKTASLCSFGSQNWSAVMSDGRFDTNNLESISSLAWVLPDERMRAYPTEIFMKQYYEPGLVRRLTKGVKFNDVPSITSINRAQPIVTIDGIVPHKDSVDLVDITVSYQSIASEQPSKKGQMSGVYDLRLFRDGQLVAYLPEGESFNLISPADLSGGSNKRQSHIFTAKLPHNGAEKYSFSAFAFNVDQVKSKTTPLWDLKMNKPLERRKGRAYVIAFGVNEYDDPNWNLAYAVADAREYENTLIPHLKEQGAFSEIVPITLVSPNSQKEFPATKEALRDVLFALSGKLKADSELTKCFRDKNINKVEPEDLVLLSFSCHGATNEMTGEFYLFPSNIGKDRSQGLTQELREKGISSAELTDWIKDIDASNMVMIIDACHSGAAEGKEFKPGPMGSRGLGQLAYYKKMAMLSASEAASTAKEQSNLGHGLLTFALLKEGLAADGRADSMPKDNRVHLRELLQFATEEVPRLDRGNFKTRSVTEAMSTTKDVEIVGINKKEREVQHPVLRDFSNEASDVCVLQLK